MLSMKLGFPAGREHAFTLAVVTVAARLGTNVHTLLRAPAMVKGLDSSV